MNNEAIIKKILTLSHQLSKAKLTADNKETFIKVLEIIKADAEIVIQGLLHDPELDDHLLDELANVPGG